MMALELDVLYEPRMLELELARSFEYKGAGGPSLAILSVASKVELLMLWERGMAESGTLVDLGFGSRELKLALLSLAELISVSASVKSTSWKFPLAGDRGILGLRALTGLWLAQSLNTFVCTGGKALLLVLKSSDAS